LSEGTFDAELDNWPLAGVDEVKSRRVEVLESPADFGFALTSAQSVRDETGSYAEQPAGAEPAGPEPVDGSAKRPPEAGPAGAGSTASESKEGDHGMGAKEGKLTASESSGFTVEEDLVA